MVEEQIVEDGWYQGWIPSSSEQADFGQASQGLLRMDNLTLDEKGSIRLINRSTQLNAAPLGYQINSCYGAYVNSRKLRYLYDGVGEMHRNYGALNAVNQFDLALGSGGGVQKAAFLNALGHVLALAGNLQIKDRGDIQWALTIPQPAAPTLTNGSSNVVQLSNLDGSGNYTNWATVQTGSFTNTGTEIDFTPISTGLAIFETVYGSLVDTTNFGATGEDTPNDLFTFSFELGDPVSLYAIGLVFFCQDPTGGSVTDAFKATILYGANGVAPPTKSVLTTITIPRSSFTRDGTTAGVGWNTIKAVQVQVQTLDSADTFKFKNIFVGSGATLGSQTYVAVELNDTGQFVQFSIASAQVSTTASINNITVDRSGTPCNSQSNNIRFFRNNVTLGQFIEVERQTGAYGFTPAPFVDNLNDADAIAAAALDTTKILQYFRTNLPTTIIGAIYFASRVIYLTSSSFIPSFQLDLGTYDGRFEYQLTGTNSELCLFICRLSVNTFIVATTVDFYQVTGTFSTVSTTNPDGTTTTTLDVTILPLGVSDPAISREFAEVEGNIFYMSARGPRSMVNAVSTLLTTTTDLLFRGETRYGFPFANLGLNDTSFIGIASSGNRTYYALPFSNGVNAIFCSTFNPPLPTELRGANYWRPIVLDTLCMAREQDGTVIYGSPDAGGNLWSLETAFAGFLSIDFLTQYNFGQHPTNTKQLGAFYLYINTGNNPLNLLVMGLQEDGTVLTYSTSVSSAIPTIVKVDPSAVLKECVAFAYQLSGSTDTFELNYSVYLIVQEYPALTYYELVPFSNFGKDTLKKLAKWGFVIDTLGNQVTARVTADSSVINSTIDESPEPQGISTEFWYNNEDIAALDWQLELIAPQGMHLFKFMPPDILQIFPPGRLLDQVGPLDLDLQGIVFGFRVRMYIAGITFHYEVFDNDVMVYSNDVATVANQDSTYIETFPKGVNTSVVRLVITAPTLMYRFSMELKVRTTGRETEEQWVKLGSK